MTMNKIIVSLLALFLPLGAVAAETYKCELEDGSVQYSERPCADGEGEKVKLPEVNAYSGAEATPRRRVSDAEASEEAEEGEADEPAAEPTGYQNISFVGIEHDQVFHNTRTVNVGVMIQPAMSKGQGVILYVNGARHNEEPGGSAFTLTELTRGTYTLRAEVVDQRGRVAARSDQIQFHVRQHSILHPPSP